MAGGLGRVSTAVPAPSSFLPFTVPESGPLGTWNLQPSGMQEKGGEPRFRSEPGGGLGA
ncbi:hypothetical protein I79_008091 [Cricetulus griseus]|uniref:Uncharacterized protein n=1 Tax=Cricetulus griseus TaxID=10029 RepID=G3HC87_CRIGR|nr:hypothetical protein I79_008091 [Cricetulus griseus]